MLPEITNVWIDLNDRLGRKILLSLNNYQKCVVGASIVEPPITVGEGDVEMDGRELYRRLISK